MPGLENLKNTNKNVREIANQLGIKTTNFWINLLHSLPPHEIGVIKASGKLLENGHLEQLAAELAYLAVEADFYLPLVLGVSAAYENNLVAGLTYNAFQPPRVTDTVIEKMVPIALENQKRVINYLSKYGVDAIALPFNNVLVQPLSEKLQYVGDVVNINTKPIIEAIYAKKVPVLSHIGYCNVDKRYYYINARMLAKEVVKWLQAQKLIFVDDYAKKPVASIVLANMSFDSEYGRLLKDGVISKDMSFNIKEAFELLKLLGPKHSIQITSLRYDQGKVQSTGLLEEILGNGSGIKVVIPPVITTFPLQAVDKDKIRMMTNQSFSDQNKVLHADYFNSIKDKGATVYLDAGGKSGAISYPLEDFEYLCKLFTLKDYEGLGIGTSIIRTILLQRGNLCWRTALQNIAAINWYKRLLQNYEGFYQKAPPYMVFGIGIAEEKRSKVVELLQNIPATMIAQEN